MKAQGLRFRALASAGALVLLALGTGPALAAAPGPAAAPARTLQYQVVDLGTLGGSNSSASAIDGDTVVGTSNTTGNTTTHAFTYDLRTRALTDLGGLLGSSGATGVSGGVVLGTTSSPDHSVTHGFAYDLRTHRTTDLGTLGGSFSSAAAVVGHTVVGTSGLAGDQATHVFTYDLLNGRRTDLGSLTGPTGTSYLGGVGGHLVVGYSPLPGSPDLNHAFSYDLLTHRTTDLGTLGTTKLLDVSGFDGRTIVGQSDATGVTGFAYDLPTGTRTDLGTSLKVHPMVSGRTVVAGDGLLERTFDLRTHRTTIVGPGNGVTQVNAVHGNQLVGDDFAVNSFAFSYRIDTAAYTTLSALGGLNSTADDSGRTGVVVGSAATTPPDPRTADGPYHAAVWIPHFA